MYFAFLPVDASKTLFLTTSTKMYLRPILAFQFPYNSSPTPYNQSDFLPEVTQMY